MWFMIAIGLWLYVGPGDLNWLESPRYPQIWVTLARCNHSIAI
jgi:hypothetical protein